MLGSSGRGWVFHRTRNLNDSTEADRALALTTRWEGLKPCWYMIRTSNPSLKAGAIGVKAGAIRGRSALMARASARAPSIVARTDQPAGGQAVRAIT